MEGTTSASTIELLLIVGTIATIIYLVLQMVLNE
mgnify:CR=1 FL=1